MGTEVWGWGRDDWVACWSVRLLGPFWVSALFSEQETRDYRKYDMTFFLDQTTLSSSSSLSKPVLASKEILSCTEAPPQPLQPEWHYHHNQAGDLWHLTSQRVRGGGCWEESQAGFLWGFRRGVRSCKNCANSFTTAQPGQPHLNFHTKS